MLVINLCGRIDFMGKGNTHFFFYLLLQHYMKVFSESAYGILSIENKNAIA